MPAVLNLIAPDSSLLWLFFLVLGLFLMAILAGVLSSGKENGAQPPPPASSGKNESPRRRPIEKKPAK